MTFRKVLVKRLGKTDLAMKESTARAKSMEKATTCGVTAVSTKATGMETRYKAVGLTDGLMAENSQASGSKTKCTVRGLTPGLTDVVTRVCMKTI